MKSFVLLGLAVGITTAQASDPYPNPALLPRCSKEFVQSWFDFRDGGPTAEMPPLPTKPCRLVAENQHVYICSEEMGGCGAAYDYYSEPR